MVWSCRELDDLHNRVRPVNPRMECAILNWSAALALEISKSILWLLRLILSCDRQDTNNPKYIVESCLVTYDCKTQPSDIQEATSKNTDIKASSP